MAQCKYCGAETQLFDSGMPICLDCAAATEKHNSRPRAPESDRVEQNEESTKAG